MCYLKKYRQEEIFCKENEKDMDLKDISIHSYIDNVDTMKHINKIN